LMGTAAPLVTAFKRMAAHNLSNLRPHPLYVAFHYSHPPLSQRIELLERTFSRGRALQKTSSR
jgi:STE24 endopeptidase